MNADCVLCEGKSEQVYVIKTSIMPLENVNEQIDTKTARNHACRIACQLLLNKQFSGKAQTRHIGAFNPIVTNPLYPAPILYQCSGTQKKLLLRKNDSRFLK